MDIMEIKELIKRDNRITRAFDRIALLLVILVSFNLSGNIKELNGIALYLLYFLMIASGIAMVLMAAMDVFDFMSELSFEKDYYTDAEYEEEILDDMGFKVFKSDRTA